MTRTCRALLVVCAVCGAIPGERSALGLRLTEKALHDTSPVEARLACAGNNNDKEPGVVFLTAYPTWGSGTLRGAAMARALDSTTTNWVVSFHKVNTRASASAIRALSDRRGACIFVKTFDPGWRDTHACARVRALVVVDVLDNKLYQKALTSGAPPRADVILTQGPAFARRIAARHDVAAFPLYHQHTNDFGIVRTTGTPLTVGLLAGTPSSMPAPHTVRMLAAVACATSPRIGAFVAICQMSLNRDAAGAFDEHMMRFACRAGTPEREVSHRSHTRGANAGQRQWHEGVFVQSVDVALQWPDTLKSGPISTSLATRHRPPTRLLYWMSHGVPVVFHAAYENYVAIAEAAGYTLPEGTIPAANDTASMTRVLSAIVDDLAAFKLLRDRGLVAARATTTDAAARRLAIAICATRWPRLMVKAGSCDAATPLVANITTYLIVSSARGGTSTGRGASRRIWRSPRDALDRRSLIIYHDGPLKDSDLKRTGACLRDVFASDGRINALQGRNSSVEQTYLKIGAWEPYEGSLVTQSAKILVRKVAAIADALRRAPDNVTVVWVDGDVVLQRALDARFLGFCKRFDVVYTAFRGRAANTLGLGDTSWRVESGVIAFTANARSRALAEAAMQVYDGALLSIITRCASKRPHSECAEPWLARNLFMNDVYVWALLLHGSHRNSSLLRDLIPSFCHFATILRQGWFTPSARGNGARGGALASSWPYVAPFNLTDFARHFMKRGTYSHLRTRAHAAPSKIPAHLSVGRFATRPLFVADQDVDLE